MALTPMDIHHKEFKTARFGGYNEEEVDSFLDLVADELERLTQENIDLLQQMGQMKQRLAEFEEMQSTLQTAILAATRAAEMVKEQARQESEVMITKARDEADSMINGAKEQALEVNLSTKNERQQLERSFTRLKEIKKRYIQSIKELADSNLAQVAEIEADGEPPDHDGEAELKEIEKAEAKTSESMPVRPAAEARPVSTPEVEMAATPAPPPVIQPLASDNRDVMVAAQPQGVQTRVAPRPPVETVFAASEPEVRPPSSDLVDEVLAVDAVEDPYGDIGDEDLPEMKENNRKGRRDRKDKHFFWE
jgi:cell division initiation protein